MGPWALRPSHCLLLACISFLAFHQSLLADHVRPSVVYPFLKVTYKVIYVPVVFSTQINNTCSRFYAENFLQDFYNLQSNFTGLCNHGASRRVTAEVAVIMVARVHLRSPSVELEINITIRANGTQTLSGQIRETIVACNQTLEGHFRNIGQFEDESHTFLRMPAGTLNCPTMEMRPERLSWMADRWTCPDRWEYRSNSFMCLYVGEIHSPTSQKRSARSIASYYVESEPANECGRLSSCLSELRMADDQQRACIILSACRIYAMLNPSEMCNDMLNEAVANLGFNCNGEPPSPTTTPTTTSTNNPTPIPTTTTTTTTTTPTTTPTTTTTSSVPATTPNEEPSTSADDPTTASSTSSQTTTMASSMTLTSDLTSTLSPATDHTSEGLIPNLTPTMVPISTVLSITESVTTVASTTDPVSTMDSTTDPTSTLASTTDHTSTLASTTDPTSTIDSTTDPTSTMESTTDPASTMELTTDPTSTMESTTDPTSTMESTTDPTSTMESTTDPTSTMESSTDPTSTMESTTDPTSTMESTTDPTSTIESTTDPISTLKSTAGTVISTTDFLSTRSSTPDALSTIASTGDLVSTPDIVSSTEGPTTPLPTFTMTPTSTTDWEQMSSKDVGATTSATDMAWSTPTLPTSPGPTNPITSSMETGTMTTVPLTTTPPPLLPDAWDIKIKDNVSSVELVEGSEAVFIEIHARANMSSVCEGMSDCQLAIGFRFTHGAFPQYRKLDQSIAQVVVGQPLLEGQPLQYFREDFCMIQLEWYSMNGALKIPLQARLDGKYDGTQTRMLNISLRRVINNTMLTELPAAQIKITIEDRDRKATCSSINDPHLGTFDGLEWNNYYEGEFILYQHKSGLFQANTVYQLCGPGVNASCNCAVAVKSGDDVIVIDKCRRMTPAFFGLGSMSSNPATVLSTTVYVNGQLTPGTRIFEEADGMKINVYLPLGTYIKVLVNGNFLNVWVVPSASDYQNTAGMCGSYDGEILNDLTFRNNTMMFFEVPTNGSRLHPDEFALDWRVDGSESLMSGVRAAEEEYLPPKYCECEMDMMITEPHCGFAYDVATQDIYAGTDITDELLQTSSITPSFVRRRRRNTDNNIITVPTYPIDVNPNFIPQIPEWRDGWNFDKAYDVCQNAIQFSAAGMLCTQLPAVNMEQEILTCVEDIQITANESWVSSALDAMVQKCLEEVQRNGSIPSDIANSIESQLCVHECSGNGECRNAVCVCTSDYAGADCSNSRLAPPDISQLPAYGLCDLQRDANDCSNVAVFGTNFINSTNLTCHLQPVKLILGQYILLPGAVNLTGVFINFNEVRCPVPQTLPYLLQVSNDGDMFSNQLLFIPYDSVCNTCSTNTSSCVKLANSCVIDGRCYSEGDRSMDGCLQCSPVHNDLEWTSVTDEPHCQSTVYLVLPDWLVAVIAAVAGSVTGVLCGFLMYWCFCKSSCRNKSYHQDDFSMEAENDPDSTPNFDPAIEESILHRNPDLSAFSHPAGYHDRGWRPYDYDDANYRNDVRGVENELNDDSYF